MFMVLYEASMEGHDKTCYVSFDSIHLIVKLKTSKSTTHYWNIVIWFFYTSAMRFCIVSFFIILERCKPLIIFVLNNNYLKFLLYLVSVWIYIYFFFSNLTLLNIQNKNLIILIKHVIYKFAPFFIIFQTPKHLWLGSK